MGRTSSSRRLRAAAPRVQQQWPGLTPRDVRESGGRADLARRIAWRNGVTVGEAKRQVRDFLRALRLERDGRAPRNARLRKAVERTRSGGSGLEQGGWTAAEPPGGLAGESGTDEDLGVAGPHAAAGAEAGSRTGTPDERPDRGPAAEGPAGDLGGESETDEEYGEEEAVDRGSTRGTDEEHGNPAGAGA